MNEEPYWLQSLKAAGLRQGYLTHAALNARLPLDLVDPEKIEAIVDMLRAAGIRIEPDV